MIKPLIAAVAAALVLVPAALAADPSSALTADIQKLTTDRASMHATVIADIQKLTADAQADLQAAKAAGVKLGALKTQLQQLRQLAQQDQADFQQDLAAAKQALAALKQSFHK